MDKTIKSKAQVERENEKLRKRVQQLTRDNKEHIDEIRTLLEKEERLLNQIKKIRLALISKTPPEVGHVVTSSSSVVDTAETVVGSDKVDSPVSDVTQIQTVTDDPTIKKTHKKRKRNEVMDLTGFQYERSPRKAFLQSVFLTRHLVFSKKS